MIRDQQLVLKGRKSDEWYVLYILLEKCSGLVAGERIELRLLGRDGWRLVNLERGLRGHYLLNNIYMRVLFVLVRQLEKLLDDSLTRSHFELERT